MKMLVIKYLKMKFAIIKLKISINAPRKNLFSFYKRISKLSYPRSNIWMTKKIILKSLNKIIKLISTYYPGQNLFKLNLKSSLIGPYSLFYHMFIISQGTKTSIRVRKENGGTRISHS